MKNVCHKGQAADQGRAGARARLMLYISLRRLSNGIALRDSNLWDRIVWRHSPSLCEVVCLTLRTHEGAKWSVLHLDEHLDSLEWVRLLIPCSP
jgi:hypothetical protein